MSDQSPALWWRSAALTDIGRVRKSNQDAFLDRPDLGLWVVADGMGGHFGGELASGMIVERLQQLSPPRLLDTAADELCARVADVNRDLIEEASRLHTDAIGSTLAALLAVGAHAAILWVGDSRVYRLRDNALTLLTRDHTHAQLLVEVGQLTPEQAEGHPLGNVLVRAVGGDPDLRVERRLEALRAGDRFLLCSDGLLKELPLSNLRELLQDPDPQHCATTLVTAACQAGGRDNVTVVVVDILSS